MFFLGNTFYGNKFSADPTLVSMNNLTYIKISDAIFDELFISRNPAYDMGDKKWDFDVVFWAKFQFNLLAGNIMESLDDITSVRIKRRRADTYDWITLLEIPFTDIESINFEHFDRYVAAGEEYEYTIIFMTNTTEGVYKTNRITPRFDGLFVLDRDYIFYSMMEHYIPQIEQNHAAGIIPTIEKVYPFSISNSANNYTSGSVSGIFAEIEDCEIDFQGMYKYQKGFLKWLADGRPKFLKYYNGETWMITVHDNPRRAQEVNTEKYTVSFSWTEIGDAESEADLLLNGFIDLYDPDVTRKEFFLPENIPYRNEGGVAYAGG